MDRTLVNVDEYAVEQADPDDEQVHAWSLNEEKAQTVEELRPTESELQKAHDGPHSKAKVPLFAN